MEREPKRYKRKPYKKSVRRKMLIARRARGQNKIAKPSPIARFPVDLERRNLWFSLVGLDPNQRLPKHPEICSEHFDPASIIVKRNGLRYVKPEANPEPIDPLFSRSMTYSKRRKTDQALDETSCAGTSHQSSSLEQHPDVPDLLSVHQPTPVDESDIKIEIEEEPLKIENDLLTSDIHEGPILPFIQGEPSEEPNWIPSETVEQLDESERQSIQTFFDSMAKTVMTLSPSFVSRIKLEVLRVVTDMEMEAYNEKMEQSKEPIRIPHNVFAASEETEPRIKIENEDDGEAEALNEPDEPDSLDPNPDHDVNYEPLPKKKRKAKAAQSTSSSSALPIDRTPRTQYEPVEMFFQSLAYTVTSFPPPLACKAKVAVLKVISRMEVEACKSRQSGCQDGGGEADDSSTGRHLPN